MPRRFACCLLFMLMLLAVGVHGCGSKVEMRVVDPMAGTSQADQEKIRGYLEAAGIKGEIYTIVDDGNQWMVDVGAPKPAPGKRAAPTMPTTYLVDKTTGKVTGGAESSGT